MDGRFHTAFTGRVEDAEGEEGIEGEGAGGEHDQDRTYDHDSQSTGTKGVMLVKSSEAEAEGGDSAGNGRGITVEEEEEKEERGIPDNFMFTGLATLQGLSLAVQRGGLTDEQKERYAILLEGGALEGEDDDDDDMMIHSQPWCPWFTCCY